jgi:hypothetical protein
MTDSLEGFLIKASYNLTGQNFFVAFSRKDVARKPTTANRQVSGHRFQIQEQFRLQ